MQISKIIIEDKRGLILPEVIKLVIAAICIGLLIMLAVNLFGLFKAKTKIEQAKAGNTDIFNLVSSLRDNESKDYLIVGPKGWEFSYFGIETGRELPKSCGGESCICICPINQDRLSSCDEEGACRKAVKRFFLSAGSISLSNAPTKVNFAQKEGKVYAK